MERRDRRIGIGTGAPSREVSFGINQNGTPARLRRSVIQKKKRFNESSRESPIS